MAAGSCNEDGGLALRALQSTQWYPIETTTTTCRIITTIIDFNHGWKTKAGENPISFTSTLLSLRYRFNDLVTMQSGFDNRRNIRLYRDHDTPETEFDEAYRLGWSARADINPAPTLRFGLGARTYGGSSGSSNSYTATARIDRLTPARVGLATRHTRYDGPSVTGWLLSLAATGNLGARRRLELHTGLRDENRTLPAGSRNITRWYGAQLDVSIARGLFLMLSFEANRSDIESNDQTFSSLSYRF